jgi:hypothetical protein
MSIHIDLLIPSFSVPLANVECTTTDGLSDHVLQNLHDQCAMEFGVDVSDVEVFQLFNHKKDLRVGCYIKGSSKYHNHTSNNHHTTIHNALLLLIVRSNTTHATPHLHVTSIPLHLIPTPFHIHPCYIRLLPHVTPMLLPHVTPPCYFPMLLPHATSPCHSTCCST